MTEAPFLLPVSGPFHRTCGEALPVLYGYAYCKEHYDVYVYAWRPFHLAVRFGVWCWRNRWALHRAGARLGFLDVEDGALDSSGRWRWDFWRVRRSRWYEAGRRAGIAEGSADAAGGAWWDGFSAGWDRGWDRGHAFATRNARQED